MNKKFVELIDQNKDVQTYDKRSKRIFKHMILKKDEIEVGGKKLILSNSDNAQPVIKVNKEGDIIQQIEITCKCGEKIYLDFKYEQ